MATKHKTKIIHKHPRKGPSWFALLLAHTARGMAAIGRQARREFPAHAKQGPTFATKRAGAGARVGPSRGRGGPMGAEPKGTGRAWDDRDDRDLHWRGDEDGWRDDELDDIRNADERIQDLRDAGYDGDIDADGYPLDDSGAWDDVDQADWSDTGDTTADSGAGAGSGGGDAA